jgi:hypothetical protein
MNGSANGSERFRQSPPTNGSRFPALSGNRSETRNGSGERFQGTPRVTALESRLPKRVKWGDPLRAP